MYDIRECKQLMIILRTARHYYHVSVHYITVIPVSHLALFSVGKKCLFFFDWSGLIDGCGVSYIDEIKNLTKKMSTAIF